MTDQGVRTIRRNAAPDWLFASNEQRRVRRQNSLLRDEEWRVIDDAVIRVAEERLVIIDDLRGRGLTRPIDGLGVLETEYENVSDLTPAEENMSGATQSEEDLPEFDSNIIPIPVTFKDFRIMRRFLEASRRRGEGLDTLGAELATRQVVEHLENMVFNGGNITLSGNSIPGLTDFSARQTYTISTAWDAVSSNDTILDDVLNIIQKAHDVNYYGPFNLYVPGNWGTVFFDDFKAESDMTVLERLESIPSINRVRISDKLTDSNVVLVQMTSDVIDLAVANDVEVVDRMMETEFILKMKVFAAMTPRLKKNADGNTGIVHAS